MSATSIFVLGTNGCEKRTSPQTTEEPKKATEVKSVAEDLESVLGRRRVAVQGGGGGDLRQIMNDAINQHDFSEPEDNEDDGDWIQTDQ